MLRNFDANDIQTDGSEYQNPLSKPLRKKFERMPRVHAKCLQWVMSDQVALTT